MAERDVDAPSPDLPGGWPAAGPGGEQAGTPDPAPGVPGASGGPGGPGGLEPGAGGGPVDPPGEPDDDEYVPL